MLPEINTGFGSGFGYIVPKYEAGLSATEDTNAYKSQPYRYHTFTMEFLPHEIRYLLDSVVVRRIPDRLVPTSSPYFDYVTREPRSPAVLMPAGFGLDIDQKNNPYASNPGDNGWYERQFFETHASDCSGCWPVTIAGALRPAAHHLLDYVKVWNVPSNVSIKAFPR